MGERERGGTNWWHEEMKGDAALGRLFGLDASFVAGDFVGADLVLKEGAAWMADQTNFPMLSSVLSPSDFMA